MTSQAPPLLPDYARPMTGRPAYFYESFRWRLLVNGTWMVLLLVMLAGAMVLLILATPVSWARLDGLGRSCLPIAFTVPAMVVIIAAGGLDLSIGAVATLAMVIFAQPVFGSAPVLGLLVVALIAAVIGLINGAMVGGAGLPGAVVTLCVALILRGSAIGVGGTHVMTGPQIGMINSVPMSIALWVLCLTWSLLALAGCELTGFGLRPSPEAAHGERAWRRTLFIALPYVASSLTAACAGIAHIHYIGAADPMAGRTLELDAITAVVVGGTLPGGRFGNVVGAMVAVLLLAMISTLLTVQSVDYWMHGVVKGALLLIFLGVVRLHYFLAGVIYSARR